MNPAYFDTILHGNPGLIVRVSERARYPGAPARADMQDWARAQGRLMLALPGDGGPDLWRAWISPVRAGTRISRLAQGAPERSGRAQELEAALETYRSAAREAETRWLEQRSALLKALKASQARCARLEADLPASGAPDRDVDALHREAAEAEARHRILRDDLLAELAASRARGVELGRALQRVDIARTQAEAELETTRQRIADFAAQQSDPASPVPDTGGREGAGA